MGLGAESRARSLFGEGRVGHHHLSPQPPLSILGRCPRAPGRGEKTALQIFLCHVII